MFYDKRLLSRQVMVSPLTVFPQGAPDKNQTITSAGWEISANPSAEGTRVQIPAPPPFCLEGLACGPAQARMSLMTQVATKRRLHEADSRSKDWLSRSHQERLAAVEAIRCTTPDSHHAQQVFPRFS